MHKDPRAHLRTRIDSLPCARVSLALSEGSLTRLATCWDARTSSRRVRAGECDSHQAWWLRR